MGSLFKEDEDEPLKRSDTQVNVSLAAEEPLIRSDRSVSGKIVPRTDVRKAYLQLAKHYHPDKGGDQEMFVTLHAAYDILVRADSATSRGPSTELGDSMTR